ncbi:Di-tripeptide/cation symporter [hydrothermal vent metagenome]|uniref:Di-tripeptide/cation symporter n=1 Tax=hydrothermal vent metagenome TaxID=652676 RepID=A0A3B1DMW8_9ZZZZ
MSQQDFLTAPRQSTEIPSGIPYIISNEAAERFSFYGMKAILFVYMTKYLYNASGEYSLLSESEATANVHYFGFAVYFFPFLGAILADMFLGKYRTILYLSIVYCLGHFVLAVANHDLGISDDVGLFAGLLLIAFGAGGIKSCVSAHVGDQFGTQNKHFMSKVFAWFYFSINLGAGIATLLTPYLLEHPTLIAMGINTHLAFGIPGILMAIATCFFWMGRNKFIHIPPKGILALKEAFSAEGIKAILNLTILYLFVTIFWSLFDQTASTWVAQAEKMNRDIFGWKIKSAQVQTANPIFILLLIPIFSHWVYPQINKIFTLTPFRKIGIGFFLTVVTFSIIALIEQRITAGETPHVAWQILAFFVLTSAEVMISITCLEFSYTQAPKAMKSFIMSLYLLSVSAGNLLAALVNTFMIYKDENGDVQNHLEGASYFWFFTGMMLIAALLFVGVSHLYKGKTYIQDDLPAAAE